jgi:hypothetical protein
MESINQTESIPFQEETVKEEKSLLEKFTGKAKNVARVMALVSALSAAPGLVPEAHAQQAPDTKTEQVEKNTINEANVTESGKWVRDILEKAKSELSEVETKKDAIIFINVNMGDFIKEYRFPTKGNIRKAEYNGKIYDNIVTRKYTKEDSKIIIETAKEFKTILQDLNSKFSLEGYDKTQNTLDEVINKATEESSYTHRKQQEILDREVEVLDKYQNKK